MFKRMGIVAALVAARLRGRVAAVLNPQGATFLGERGPAFRGNRGQVSIGPRVLRPAEGERSIRRIAFVYRTVGDWEDGRARVEAYGIR